MFVRRESFRITYAEFVRLVQLAFLSNGAALFLISGYRYCSSSGVATTLHFTYPILTALIMMIFFRERSRLSTWMAIGLSIAGVALLSGVGGGGAVVGDRARNHLRTVFRSLPHSCQSFASVADAGGETHLLCDGFRRTHLRRLHRLRTRGFRHLGALCARSLRIGLAQPLFALGYLHGGHQPRTGLRHTKRRSHSRFDSRRARTPHCARTRYPLFGRRTHPLDGSWHRVDSACRTYYYIAAQA